MKLSRSVGWSRSSPPVISQPAKPAAGHVESYSNFYKSAAKQLREAANALDEGKLGRAQAEVQNAITTMRYVQDHAQSAFNKARRKAGRK